MLYKFKTLFEGDEISLMVHITNYSNDRPAIELLWNDPEHNELHTYAIATVNMPEVNLKANEVLIKNYSENEGVLQFLVDNKIVVPTGKIVETGYVKLPICILNPESEWKA
jgi:hypothetical protein